MAIERGFDKKLNSIYEQKLVYLPFAHFEKLEDQARSVELNGNLGNKGWTQYCIYYYDTIKNFGRFPYREQF
jgi:uncharacterized protein (DUF924 family)